MSPFGTFLLVVAAFVGTVVFFTSPLVKLQKWMQGKKASEIQAAIKERLEEEPGQTAVQGCGLLVFFLISLAYTFVVEPVAVIAALVKGIGYLPLAYAMLVIIGLSWIIMVRVFMSSNKETVKGTVVTDEGERVEGEVIEVDKEIKFRNPLLITLRRIFFFLPDLYLWYLFLVVINVIPS